MPKRELTNSFLSAFCLEISMFLQAGITLTDGLQMLLDDEHSADGKAVLNAVLNGLESGAPFSAALDQAGFFPRYMVNMAIVGEKTGRIAETAKALAEHYDRQERLAVSVKNAALYPAILLVMMKAVVLILIVYVLPIFNDVFGRMGAQMSPVANRLMQAGTWMGAFSAVFAIAFGVFFAVLLLLWFVPALRRSVSDTLQRRFGGRGVFSDIAASRFVSAMALALASGLDNREAGEMAAAISGGAVATEAKNIKCLELLDGGSNLSDAMRGAGIISTRESRMLSLSIRSGMVDTAMEEIARRKERLAQDRIENIVGRIEPALVIITSVIVGVILLSVMLPLMGIMTSIG